MIVKYRFEIYFLTLTEFSYMRPHLIIHFISIDSDSTICYYGLNSKINKVYSLLLRSSKSSGSDIIIFHIYTTKNFISHDIMLDSHTKCLLTSCCNFCITDLLASSWQSVSQRVTCKTEVSILINYKLVLCTIGTL